MPGPGHTLLITGFDPFDGAVLNPSWQAAQALDGRILAGHRVVAAQLPTVFGQALPRLDTLLSQHRPVMVVCLGLAQTRRAISLERIAINVDDARIPDNAGRQPVDQPVVPGGPAAYFSTLPIKAMLHALTQAGIPAEVSQTAGTFVCNHVFYGLMHRLATTRLTPPARGGFIHVPPLADAGLSTGMPLATLVAGLDLALSTALRQGGDMQLGAGAVD